MVERESLGRGEQALELRQRRVGGGAELEREPHADGVGGREPEVDPSARRAYGGGHDVDEGGDVVAGHRLPLRPTAASRAAASRKPPLTRPEPLSFQSSQARTHSAAMTR